MELEANRPREVQAFIPLRSLSVPGSLVALDGILREACGTGFDGINAVLVTALDWTPGHDHVVEVSRDDLRREIIAWSGLSAGEIDAALDRLILEPAQLRGEGLRYWEQERRRYRLATRPLLSRHTGNLLLMPWRILATQHVYAAYVLDGGLPWHTAETPQQVLDALSEFRKVQNRTLERETSNIVDGLGLPHRSGIEPHQAASFGLKIPGEIDLLVADPRRSRMWVCEVKDISFAVSPSTIAQRVAKFLKRKGYVSQLIRATEAVQANPTAAARLVQVPVPEREWQVIPLMITRRVEPAAFADDLIVSFVVVRDFATAIEQDVVPPIGHFPVSGI